MPKTELNRQKETLIVNIQTEITEEEDLKILTKQFNKILAKKEATAKKAQRALCAASASQARIRVPVTASLLSDKNITNEQAFEELYKMIEIWK